jgi:hypothetical protein
MPTFTDRVEAQYTVPSSTTVSVSSGALTSAVSVTWTAGSYFHTAAGGVSSGLTVLQTAINAALSPYPNSAASVRAMLGGDWSSGAGWLCQETSGNLSAAFGGVTLTAVSSPTYSNTGPGNGGDIAVGFNSAADAFNGGDVFDLTDTGDIIIAWVAKHDSAPAGDTTFITKRTADAGWQLVLTVLGTYTFRGYSAGPVEVFSATGASIYAGEWHVGIATVDRATGKARVGTYGLTSGTASVSSEATAAVATSGNAVAFSVGDGASAASGGVTSGYLAALYAVAGNGAATGLSANLSATLTNFANAVSSDFSISLSTSTGLVTLSNTFWPCSIDFTSTDARDLLGFAHDFNYPQTAALVHAATGSYASSSSVWSSGWLCDESSGSLADSLASRTLSPSSTPTYSNAGPLGGGNDNAVGFNSADDAFQGGDIYDVGASESFFFLMVVYFDSVSGNRDVFGKGFAPGYLVTVESGVMYWVTHDGTDVGETSVAVSAGVWYAVMGVIDRANNLQRLGVCPLTGSPTVSSSVSVSSVGNLSNATAFALGDQNIHGASNTQVAALYVGGGAAAAAGTLVTNLSSALTTFVAYLKSQTGTEQAEGIWFPDCNLSLDGDPGQAPLLTDRRTTISPTKRLFALCGNSGYGHTGLAYQHVPRAQVWSSAATYTNGSWEEFAKACIFGLGHEWFTASSPLQFYWYDGSAGALDLLGAEGNSGAGMTGWRIVNLDRVQPQRSVDTWTGLFRIEIGEVVSDG